MSRSRRRSPLATLHSTGCVLVAIVALTLLAAACTEPSEGAAGIFEDLDGATDASSAEPGGSAGHSGQEGHDGHGGQGGHDGHGGHGGAAGTVRAGAAAPTRHTGPQGRVGQIVTDCGYSHSAPDDPIVHPGKPGRSHRHDFFGNTTTDAHSTLASLLAGSTTCQKRMDTAAYWAPSLLDHGEPVTPTKSTAYYRPAPGVDETRVRNFPPDLRIVAGDMTAIEPQSPDLAGWACGSSSRHHAEPPSCPDSAPLHAVITFPDCWDGERTDSPDHMSHMANSAEGACPPSHPVHVPQLTFVIVYPIAGDGHDLTLASGSTLSLHSDFMNSWDSDGLGREIELCLHRSVVCGLSSNRDEEALFRG